MGVCIFVASGVDFDVDGYLRESPFEPSGIFHRGHVPKKGSPQKTPRPDSGFSVVISDSDQPGLGAVIDEALAFLKEHERDINALRKAGADNLLLDFGVELRGEVQRSEYLPAEITRIVGRLGLGLVFTAVRLPEG